MMISDSGLLFWATFLGHPVYCRTSNLYVIHASGLAPLPVPFQ